MDHLRLSRPRWSGPGQSWSWSGHGWLQSMNFSRKQENTERMGPIGRWLRIFTLKNCSGSFNSSLWCGKTRGDVHPGTRRRNHLFVAVRGLPVSAWREGLRLRYHNTSRYHARSSPSWRGPADEKGESQRVSPPSPWYQQLSGMGVGNDGVWDEHLKRPREEELQKAAIIGPSLAPLPNLGHLTGILLVSETSVIPLCLHERELSQAAADSPKAVCFLDQKSFQKSA